MIKKLFWILIGLMIPVMVVAEMQQSVICAKKRGGAAADDVMIKVGVE